MYKFHPQLKSHCNNSVVPQIDPGEINVKSWWYRRVGGESFAYWHK